MTFAARACARPANIRGSGHTRATDNIHNSELSDIPYGHKIPDKIASQFFRDDSILLM